MSNPTADGAIKKHKRTPQSFAIGTFPQNGFDIAPSGSFLENITEFVENCSNLQNNEVDGHLVYRTVLDLENEVRIHFYIVAEDVEPSIRTSCKHCKICGWREHYASRRSYHFIIPKNNELIKGFTNDETHTLYAIIHGDASGHLITINGIEGGSKHLRGKQIMDLWDRICTFLRTRKITVRDESKKHKMDLRLVYAVAYEGPWFGRWNYRFCQGSFGVTKFDYDHSKDYISSFKLQTIVEDFTSNEELKKIISYYKELSEFPLVTLGDLLRFMLTGKTFIDAYKVGKPAAALYNHFSTVAASNERYTRVRMQQVANLIVDKLKQKRLIGINTVKRQELREGITGFDKGLVDYVMKFMHNVILGEFVVHRDTDPATRNYIYSLKDAKNSGLNVINDDLKILYKNVFSGHPNKELAEGNRKVFTEAVGTIINSKVFVKDQWSFIEDEQKSSNRMNFFCTVKPALDDFNNDLFEPEEIIISVPLLATIKDLKNAAQQALRDTYFVTHKVIIQNVEGKQDEADDELLSGISGMTAGTKLVFRGTDIFNEKSNYSGNTVKCKCGTSEDDGEKMIECSNCKRMHHLLCQDYDDLNQHEFACPGCKNRYSD